MFLILGGEQISWKNVFDSVHLVAFKGIVHIFFEGLYEVLIPSQYSRFGLEKQAAVQAWKINNVLLRTGAAKHIVTAELPYFYS